jgi:hypothetical protein
MYAWQRCDGSLTRRPTRDFSVQVWPAGIRRVKGAKKLGMRLGNWLTAEGGRALWQLPNMHTVKGKRDRAILAVLRSFRKTGPYF